MAFIRSTLQKINAYSGNMLNTGSFICLIVSLLLFTFLKPLFFLEADQIEGLYSTLLQIVIGLYGIAIAVYVFFIGFLYEKSKNDDIRKETIEQITEYYFSTLIYMSSLALVILFLGIVCICLTRDKANFFILKLVMNYESAFVINEIILIILFSIKVVSPNSDHSISNEVIDNIENKSDGRNIDLRTNKDDYIKEYKTLEEQIKQNTPNLDNIRLIARVKWLKENEVLDDKDVKKFNRIYKVRNLLYSSDKSEVLTSIYNDLKELVLKLKK